MAVESIEIKSSRGIYRLKLARGAERLCGDVLLTLILERSDGLETVAFRCRVAPALAGSEFPDSALLLERLGSWLERDFEETREAALKSIRGEGKLLEVRFDQSSRGPF